MPDSSIHPVHAHEEPRIYGELAVYVPAEKMGALQRAQCESFLDRAETELKGQACAAIGDILMGSVAMKVLHASRLPVLLVR